ncbi:MAG: ATP-binding cassette domain-containing protein [Geodermatophilaceae bacterium]
MRAARWPIRRVTAAPDAAADPGSFPANVPAVAQLLRDGLELGPATVLVGENGSGKSTLIEAIALSYGLSAEGGSTGALHSTRSSESGLWDLLTLSRNPGSTRWGYFLRAETMHGFFSYLEDNPARSPEAVFHELSHGESFLELIRDRFTGPGLYLLDEPESALSFTGCLALLTVLVELVGSGTAQVILSTHSALLAALPGADILEIGGWGMRTATWSELDLVQNWRAFLGEPEAFLRHLVD